VQRDAHERQKMQRRGEYDPVGDLMHALIHGYMLG
jgi:hypothetical protein